MGSERRWWWNRDAMMKAWVAASVAVCVCGHLYFRAYTMIKAEELLVSMCEERAHMLQDRFAVSVNHVHALAILISTFHYQMQPSALDKETFAYYTERTAFERPLLNGVAYAQRVLHSERDKFERQQGWMIKTMKGEPSPLQDEYAPVIFSQETVSYIEALDMMSGEEDRENILRSRETGKAALTRPFRLLGSNHLGVVLTFPVYSSDLPSDATVEERVEATTGYLGGAFDVESLVEYLLKQLADSQDIVVNVYDVTNTSDPLTMYGPHYLDGYLQISHVSMLDFGDPFRKHQMECRYSEKPPIPLSAITTPCGILVILLLLAYIVFAAWGRYDNVKEDFRKMEELKVQAEAADIAKSQFLATVSHEIRTPMNGVLGMLDMLLDTNLNFTQKDYAQTAQVCGKELIALINEVLDRAKIEAGKLELEEVRFDLRIMLDDLLSLFSAKLREKGIELAVFVSDGVPEVLMGDPGRFRQIITNLVGNSVKFTERGHIFVQVHLAEDPEKKTDAKDEAGLNGWKNETEVNSNSPIFDTLSGLETADVRNSWEKFRLILSDEAVSENEMPAAEHSDKVTLVVSVEDTGIGIPLQAQDRVFTPFMQADSSTSRNYGGTGIGLSISKCLVEMMGGKIDFISRPNIGSTFVFSAVFRSCKQTECNDTKRSRSLALPTDFKGTSAILVDQRPVRGAVTKYHLQRLGITVEATSTLEMAKNSSKSGKQPRIMLVESDSWSLDKFIEWKLNCQMPEVPKVIVLVTSECEEAKAGSLVDAVIMKPLRASTIAACFQQVLGVAKQPGKEASRGSDFLRRLLAGKNILVVDDNKVNLRVAAGALKKYGAKVECVERGKDALFQLQPPHKFDACFMDIQMPEMDGFEAARQIREMERKANEQMEKEASEDSGRANRRLPILAMTADVIQATQEECLKSGMDGYVSKPFDEEQLYQTVAKFLTKKNE